MIGPPYEPMVAGMAALLNEQARTYYSSLLLMACAALQCPDLNLFCSISTLSRGTSIVVSKEIHVISIKEGGRAKSTHTKEYNRNYMNQRNYSLNFVAK